MMLRLVEFDDDEKCEVSKHYISFVSCNVECCSVHLSTLLRIAEHVAAEWQADFLYQAFFTHKDNLGPI